MEENKTIFQPVEPANISDNYIRLIGKDWMLVTAGRKEGFNTMTASWGGVGFLWNKPVVFIFIRPQRYTFGFLEKEAGFTLSFFGEEYRAALQLCGSVSGRDVNKPEKTGLTFRVTENGNVFFREARLVLECKKLYNDFIKPEYFIETGLDTKWYPEKDYHKVYVAEIVNAWEKKDA